jgi:hypothetical protein
MDEVKRLYEFDKWAGKVKTSGQKIEKLGIDPNFLMPFPRRREYLLPMPIEPRNLI